MIGIHYLLCVLNALKFIEEHLSIAHLPVSHRNHEERSKLYDEGRLNVELVVIQRRCFEIVSEENGLGEILVGNAKQSNRE